MRTTLKKGLAFRRVAGELFVVDAARSELHELNGTAAVVWEGLAAGRTEDAIVKAVTAEFDVDAASARADVRAFEAELRKAGLLVEAAQKDL